MILEFLAQSGSGIELSIGGGAVGALCGVIGKTLVDKMINGKKKNGTTDFVTKEFCNMQHDYTNESLKRIETKLDHIIESK